MTHPNFKTLRWLGRELLPQGEDYWATEDHAISVHKVGYVPRKMYGHETSSGSWRVSVSLFDASIVAHARSRRAAMDQAKRKLRNVKTSIQAFGEHI